MYTFCQMIKFFRQFTYNLSIRKMSTEFNIKYLSQQEAINIDQDLFNECAFSVDQLMELAGQSVAIAIYKSFPISSLKNNKVIVCCGPGNNGGDGLVAARHLTLFGYKPEIYYPKPGRSDLFARLVKQCNEFRIPFVNELKNFTDYSLAVDALFGFSFKPPVRAEFSDILTHLAKTKESNVKLICVDIPSGWNVETGPPSDDTPILEPECLVSLTAPKLCAKLFNGKFHWLGGRFVPESIFSKYQLSLPAFPDTEQCVLLK